MCPNSQFPADLVTLTKEILNGKLDFLCSGIEKKHRDQWHEMGCVIKGHIV